MKKKEAQTVCGASLALKTYIYFSPEDVSFLPSQLKGFVRVQGVTFDPGKVKVWIAGTGQIESGDTRFPRSPAE